MAQSEKLLLLLLLLYFFSFMQGIYIYIPETNHVSRMYSAAAVLYLQFVLHVILFRMSNIFYIFLHYYFPKYVCSAQYGLLLLLLLLLYFLMKNSEV